MTGARPTRCDSPMSVYEMHLGSWRPGLGYANSPTSSSHYLASSGTRTSS